MDEQYTKEHLIDSIISVWSVDSKEILIERIKELLNTQPYNELSVMWTEIID